MGQSMTREDLVDRIRAAAQELGVSRLKFVEFQKITGITKRRILGFFDCWSDACIAAGVDSGPTRENLVPNPAIGKEVLIAELKRVATVVGREFISQTDFREHSTLNPITPSRTFGGWAKALAAAGLKAHPFSYEEKPLEEMATKFLAIVTELRAIPTLNQVARRTGHSEYLFSGKHGGYPHLSLRATSNP